MATRPKDLSIALKVPLTAGAVVIIVAASLVTAAYLTMRSMSIRLANERLGALARYFSETYAQSNGAILAQLATQAGNDSLFAIVQAPSPEGIALAQAYLSSHASGRNAPIALQIRRMDGRVLASAGSHVASIDSLAPRDSFPRLSPTIRTGVGRLRLVHDTLVYPMVAAIGNGEPQGYLVVWRQMSPVTRLAGLMGNLLGSAGAMYFANADGSLGTDFTSIVNPPADAPKEYRGLLRYTRPPPRGAVFAAAEPIPGTPWMWMIEFPAATVLAPATLFVQRLALVALVFVALGLLVAWHLSRRLTGPLQELTQAADLIAAGDRGHRLQVLRGDELGQLGKAFNQMAGQVDESHQRLEEKVTERTRALNLALTQLREAQDSLLRREKLAMLGQLASGVGHELRNPLGVMSNAIYYLQLVQPDAAPEVKEYLGILQQQVALSGKIVSDLLDFARVTPVQREAVTLHSLVAAQRSRLPELDSIQLEADLPESLPLAQVDPVHAGQVIFNLLTNAIQAMGPGGRLRLRGSHHSGGHLQLEVSDNGPGVPPEIGDKVFEPLFTTKARGIGLGLAVSRSLAQANGGELYLHPSGGAGATFVFTMPTAGAQA